MTQELFFYLMLVGWCYAPGPDLGALSGEELTVPNVVRGLYRSHFTALLEWERTAKYRATLDEREYWRQSNLRHFRMELAFLEEAIPQHEQFAAEVELVDPELAANLRRQAAKWRDRMKELRAEERRLLERQPGGYTAPAPPREKK